MKYIESGGYTFALDINQSEDDKNIVYTFVSLKRQPLPCVRITLYKNEANLDTLNYYSSCSVKEKTLDESYGTVYMLKTALYYVIERHPKVKVVDIQDETFALTKEKPLITSRRLIQGKQGWYEEHFGAVAVGRTIRLIDYLRNPKHRTKIDVLIHDKPRSWWTASNIVALCDTIQCPSGILGTEWKIDRKTITSYRIEYKTYDHWKGGGDGKAIERRVARVLKNAIRYPYDLVLDAKYNNPKRTLA